MATTYAMPTGPGHGRHAHSHSRKTTGQRMPLQPTSMNGGYSLNGSPVPKDPSVPDDQLATDPPDALEAFPDIQPPGNHPSKLHLPKPPSFSSPNYARSKSMERRRSVGLPTHLNLQGSGYGFAATNAPKFQASDPEIKRPWITTQEAISAVIVPLPCALASLVFNIGILPHASRGLMQTASSLDDIHEEEMSNATINTTSSLAMVLGMTAMTLALTGMRGKVGQALGTIDSTREPSNLGALKKANVLQLGRRIAGRVLMVGLPFYATSHLGGLRSATILLSSLASNIMPLEGHAGDLSTWKGLKHLFTYRKWTVLSFGSQLALDLIGITSGLPLYSIGVGYVALGLSIFALPPPYPSSMPRLSIISSQKTLAGSSSWESSTKTSQGSSSSTISPLICTPEDVNLTLATATLTGVVGFLLPFAPFFSAGAASRHELAWSALTILSATCAFLFTDGKNLQRSRGFGLTIGLLTSFMLLMTAHNDEWISYLYQGVLLSVSIAATSIDIHGTFVQKSHSSHSHRHHHKHSQHGEIPGASRFSNFLLQRVQHWPLLHTIIMEKDSRRIFYFMW